MEFINGFNLADVEGMKKSGLNLKEVCILTSYIFKIT